MMQQLGRDTDPADVIGTPENAAHHGEGRHPGVRDALQWLAFSHLPEKLQSFSRPFYQAAVELVLMIDTDSPELTTALNRLIEAKDSAMRAGIRHDTGRAGSVPRPQEVVDPPKFGVAQVPARPDQTIPGLNVPPGQITIESGHLVPADVPVIDNRIGPNFGRPIQDRPQA